VSAGSPPPLRWWGWGEMTVPVAAGLLTLLRDETGAPTDRVTTVPRLRDVQLPERELPRAQHRALVEIVGGFHVRDDAEARVRHAAGRSYVDLLRLRSGALDDAPDAVVHPGNAEEVLGVLRACADGDCAVVPFGGGTSVVGGVAPSRAGKAGLIALDVDRLDAVASIDATSHLATLEAGMRGPRVEAGLGARGLTLGHFPQSFEYATVGGYAATRSSGQASAGYGRFDAMTRGMRMQTPRGELAVDALPPSAAGPSLLQVLLGSEGTLGVITDVTVRVRERSAVRHAAAWSFESFEAGADCLRRMAQSRLLPDLARLSDEEETRVNLAMARGRAARVATRYLALRGQPSPCLAVFEWEGDGDSVGARVRVASAALRRSGAVTLGAAPAKAWLRDRFTGPYLRDSLMGLGVLVETLETATTWSRLSALRASVERALRESLATDRSTPLVGCHLSHVYEEGASLYFTVLAAQDAADPIGQWLRAKRSATDAIVAEGAALSHHHGVGQDHTPWLTAAVGSEAVAVFRAVKQHVDPAGVMNPSKLFDGAG